MTRNGSMRMVTAVLALSSLAAPARAATAFGDAHSRADQAGRARWSPMVRPPPTGRRGAAADGQCRQQHPAGRAADARRRREARARSQPRHRRAAAEPGDHAISPMPASRSIYHPSLTSIIAAPVVGQPADQPNAVRAADRRRDQYTDDDGQRRRRPEHPVGRRLVHQRRSRTIHAQHDRSSTRFSIRSISRRGTGRLHPAAAARLPDRLDPPAAAGDQAQPGHLGRPAARRRSPTRSPTCATPTGTTCSRCSRSTSPSSRSTWRPSWSRTTRRASRSAPWRRSTSSRRSRRRRPSSRTSCGPGTMRTAELALKRLIVSGTQDPNWNVAARSDRPARLPPGADRHRRRRCGGRSPNAPTSRSPRRPWRRNDITLKFLGDQLKPQADASVNYGLHGLGGTQFVRSSGVLGAPPSQTIVGGLGDTLSIRSSPTTFPRWTVR